MRIGMFSPYSLTLPGGVQGQVLGLARAMRRLGHECRVLGPCDGPPPEPGITPLGNAIPLAANGSVAPIAPDPPAVLRTIRAVREEAFDVLHLHEPLVPGCTLTALLYHSAPALATFHAAGESASYKWLAPFLRAIAKKIDLRVAVSDDAAQLAGNSIGGEFTILFNGVDVERFAAAKAWPKTGRTLFFVGRHEERKGLETLLQAHARLPEDVRLWVAGTGPQTEELRTRYSSPRIEWLGRIGDGELASRWKSADVYCAPSLGGESFGVVLLESMAAGTVVVASDIAGYRNVARAEKDALVFPPGDANALARQLERVLNDDVLRATLEAEGYRRANEYSMDALAKHYVALYETILDRPR